MKLELQRNIRTVPIATYATYDALKKLSAGDARLDPILLHRIRKGSLDVGLLPFMLSIGVSQKELAEALADRLEIGPGSDVVMVIQMIGELGRVAPRGIPLLMDCACDANPDIRKSAVIALGKLGPAAILSIPVLIARQSDEDAEVRDSANRALEMLFGFGNPGMRRAGSTPWFGRRDCN